MADKTSSPARQKPKKKAGGKSGLAPLTLKGPAPSQPMQPPTTRVTKLAVAAARPKDEMVEVQCQGMNEGFQLDNRLLCEVSAEFGERISERIKYAPAQPIVVKVPHSEGAFEVVKRWRSSSPAGCHAGFGGGDEVMDAIIKLVVEHGHKFTIARLSPPKVKGFPARTSKLRELLADWIAYGEFDDRKSNAGQLPKDNDFCRLLAAPFVERKINGDPAAPFVTRPCKYHVHRKTGVCSSTMVKVEAKD
ncbi:hypothetical protein M409DRAFT_17124 [Zasmidium cellare ATCC 36951]|uniref:Uncharacterized protein n=1 Tax=Zasmidium cellare ATCC 36951 TaxID=1080233 RepID=A0A6A6D4X3_ZASCE|nr:uncharacterized protein M409DRAFT_17124 [Zasmidium cellare ATCC 36951]KAF2173179.1 hypothetical protein M409DRAFT_17124 [Zasmidium cellare ATCC 36951]